MATNRQSLKDLQERLAQRLTAAKSEAATVSWLAVEAGGERYLAAGSVGRNFPWASVQAALQKALVRGCCEFARWFAWW
jgi:twitching motility protein PilI